MCKNEERKRYSQERNKMKKLKEDIKDNLLINHAKGQIKKKEKELLKTTSWIKTRHLSNIVKEHCSVLLDALINEDYDFSFKEEKFIIDKIIDYSFEKGADLLGSKADRQTIKPLLQVNSYVIFAELMKGLYCDRSKKTISYSIDKELNNIQEQIDKQCSIEKILEEKITEYA